MRKFCIVSICCLLLAGAANADTISYTATYGNPTPLGVPYGPAVVANLQQFDQTTFGTLQSVTLELTANAFSGVITWDNESDQLTDVDLGIGATVTATAPSALTLVALPMQTGSMLDVPIDNDAAADFVGTDSFTLTGGTGTDSDSDSTSVAALMAPYIGTGTFAVSLGATTLTSATTDGGNGLTQSTPGDTDGTIKVTYTYIPEPATMSLLALGGLALLRRKRR